MFFGNLSMDAVVASIWKIEDSACSDIDSSLSHPDICPWPRWTSLASLYKSSKCLTKKIGDQDQVAGLHHFS